MDAYVVCMQLSPNTCLSCVPNLVCTADMIGYDCQ
uniref:Uncharacterized protein n=1 Tax=Rhizophora mucronata TaxID=61149 RepID=A0A2P2Q409_RHIMU